MRTLKIDKRLASEILRKIRVAFVSDNASIKKVTRNFFGVNEDAVIDSQLKRNQKNAKYILLMIVFLGTMFVIKDIVASDPYTYDGEGNVIGITRQKLGGNERFDLKIDAQDEKRDVSIEFSPDESENAENQSKKKTLEDYLSEIISQIEQSDDEKIKLPTTLEDGSKLTWSKKESNIVITMIFILGLILFSLYKSRYSKIKKQKQQAINRVRKDLPGLINKIILIWQSGKTFEDAVKESIGNLQEKGGEDFLKVNLKAIYKCQRENGGNIVFMINNFAKNTEIKDLIRITDIMAENQFKGSFLMDKLQMEREILWLGRKKGAEEEGKKAETKLVIPMAILLIVLITLTAAPAFLKM